MKRILYTVLLSLVSEMLCFGQETACTPLKDLVEKNNTGGTYTIRAEVVRVISSSPKWTPGRSKGKPVDVTYTFPVIFQFK